MEKNYKSEMSREEQDYIKNKLFEKYEKDFRIEKLDQNVNYEILHLSDFLKIQDSERFKPENMNYENDERLQNVFVVIDNQNERALFINSNDESKEKNIIPEGHIATQNLKTNEISPSTKLKEQIKKYVDVLYADDPAKAKEMEGKITRDIFHGDAKDLENIEKILEKPENLGKKIEKYCEEVNRKNGISKEDMENAKNGKKMTKETGDDSEKEEDIKKSNLPEHITKYCIMAGIRIPKAVIDTKASEAAAKIDDPLINKNGGNVTIIKVRDDSKSTDKYLVFQDNKMIIPGNRDEKIDKVVGRKMEHTKNGKLIQPLEIDDKEQFFEYSDSQGTDIEIKLEESTDLSIDDLQSYKREVQIELEKFSQELNKIDQELFVSDIEKDRRRVEANGMFNKNNKQIALKYNIDLENVKDINLETDITTNEQVEKETDEEIEAFQVPGKREH